MTMIAALAGSFETAKTGVIGWVTLFFKVCLQKGGDRGPSALVGLFFLGRAADMPSKRVPNRTEEGAISLERG